MSLINTRAAFVTKLNTLAALATEYDNTGYTPVAGTPYQSISIMPADNDDPVMGSEYRRERGIFQILLKYPSNTGTNAILTRAELIQGTFKRGLTMDYSGQRVIVEYTPTIHTGYTSGDRYVVPISIRYYTHINQ